MEENTKKTNTFQNLFLENREKLNVTGVLDVLSFDDQIIIAETDLGLLTIKGENLKINKLSLDTSDFIVEGYISNINYSNSIQGNKKSQTLLGKIFK